MSDIVIFGAGLIVTLIVGFGVLAQTCLPRQKPNDKQSKETLTSNNYFYYDTVVFFLQEQPLENRSNAF